MNGSGDPVEAALDERRARLVAERRLETRLTLADRGRDAAERRLRVRAFLIGGTSVAGTALAVDGHTMTIERSRSATTTGHVHLAIDALVRLTVADAGTRPRSPVSAGAPLTGIARTIAQLARRDTDLVVITRDGSTISGSVVALGDATIGFAARVPRSGRDGGLGTAGGSIDWVDPAQIVSVAEIA